SVSAPTTGVRSPGSGSNWIPPGIALSSQLLDARRRFTPVPVLRSKDFPYNTSERRSPTRIRRLGFQLSVDRKRGYTPAQIRDTADSAAMGPKLRPTEPPSRIVALSAPPPTQQRSNA